MLVKFNCGCIGFDPRMFPTANNKHLIVRACDYADFDLGPCCLMWRESDKGLSSFVSDDREAEHLEELARLIDDGYRFQEIKRLLKTV